MKSDLGIKQDVNGELFWEPAVDAVAIDVEVDSGAVTLTGHVCSYMEESAAEHVARRVAGVCGVVQETEVRLPGAHTDADAAQTACTAFERRVALPFNRIEVLARNGWVTFPGEADRSYQSEQTAHAVGSLRGVTGLINRLQIKARVVPADIAE